MHGPDSLYASEFRARKRSEGREEDKKFGLHFGCTL